MYKLDVVAVVFCRLINCFFSQRFERENQRQNESGSVMLKFVILFMSQIKVLLSDLRRIRFTFDYSTGESQH